MPTYRKTGKTQAEILRSRGIDEPTRQAAWEELVRLLIRGFSKKAAAEVLGFHAKTIEKWVKTPAFQILMRRTRALVFTRTQDAGDEAARDTYADTKAKIEEYAREALEKVAMMMHTSDSEPLQVRCAQDLMDRSEATQKTHKVESHSQTLVFTPQNLALAFQTAKVIAEDHAVHRHISPVEIDERMLEGPPEEDDDAPH